MLINQAQFHALKILVSLFVAISFLNIKIRILICFPPSIRVVAADGPLFSEARYLATIAEDAAAGTPVTRVAADHPSGASLVYTVVEGDPGGVFELDYSTGGCNGYKTEPFPLAVNTLTSNCRFSNTIILRCTY